MFEHIWYILLQFQKGYYFLSHFHVVHTNLYLPLPQHSSTDALLLLSKIVSNSRTYNYRFRQVLTYIQLISLQVGQCLGSYCLQSDLFNYVNYCWIYSTTHFRFKNTHTELLMNTLKSSTLNHVLCEVCGRISDFSARHHCVSVFIIINRLLYWLVNHIMNFQCNPP